MSTSNPQPKQHTATLLAKQFIADYEDSIDQCDQDTQIAISAFLLNTLNWLEEFTLSKDENIYQQFRNASEQLLQQYRNKLQQFWDKRFYTYFFFDNILAEKNIVSPTAFNQLPPDQQSPSPEEIHSFISIARSVIQSRYQLLLLQPGQKTLDQSKNIDNDEASADLPDTTITKGRQLLTIYFFLKAFKIEHRTNQNISSVARFLHLLTGTKFTTIQNSEIYKKYQKMPYYKTNEQLLKDLLFIKPYFEELILTEALVLINAEINKCITALPESKKKTYILQSK